MPGTPGARNNIRYRFIPDLQSVQLRSTSFMAKLEHFEECTSADRAFRPFRQSPSHSFISFY
jgi:hypothetical protein